MLMNQKYTGDKISVNWNNTDVKNVFKVLEEVSGTDWIVDDDVSGSVTFATEQPMPWDQIFHIIMMDLDHLGLTINRSCLATSSHLHGQEKAEFFIYQKKE